MNNQNLKKEAIIMDVFGYWLHQALGLHRQEEEERKEKERKKREQEEKKRTGFYNDNR